jgi:hypothetical protein
MLEREIAWSGAEFDLGAPLNFVCVQFWQVLLLLRGLVLLVIEVVEQALEAVENVLAGSDLSGLCADPVRVLPGCYRHAGWVFYTAYILACAVLKTMHIWNLGKTL